MGRRFTRVPNELIRTSVLSSLEKVVWIFIASHKRGYKYTGQEASDTLGISRRTWHRAVDTLVTYGLVNIDKGAGGVNNYVAILPPEDGESVVTKTTKSCAKMSQDLSKNYSPTPINREDQLEKENDIKESSAETIELETMLNGSWAETMQMNMGVDQAGLLKALKESVAYCVTEGYALTESNIRHYAYTSIKYHRRDYLSTSPHEWRDSSGKRWYTWGAATFEVPANAPPRPSSQHQWDSVGGVWYKN